MEANRKARGLMDFALDSALCRLSENPPRGHSVKEDAVFVIHSRSQSELKASKPYFPASLSKLQLKVPWQV